LILLYAHIILMAVAAILVVSAVVTARKRKPGWLNRHKAMAMTGTLCAMAAFVCMFLSKAVMHFPHFHSPHAVAGLATVIMLIITPASGVLVVSGKNGLRPLHRLLGRVTSLALVLTALSGVFRMIQISKR
jgi:uncharacterized membrane protein YozB (DUF420 family)